VCDGITDCPGAEIDESVQCTKCPDNFCLNDGKCTAYESGANCTCGDNYFGYRCSVSKAEQKKEQTTPQWVVIVSITVSIVVLALLIIVIYFFIRRRQMGELGKMGTSMENPAYDMQLSDISGSAPFNDTLQPISAGIENPLYGDIGN